MCSSSQSLSLKGRRAAVGAVILAAFAACGKRSPGETSTAPNSPVRYEDGRLRYLTALRPLTEYERALTVKEEDAALSQLEAASKALCAAPDWPASVRRDTAVAAILAANAASEERRRYSEPGDLEFEELRPGIRAWQTLKLAQSAWDVCVLLEPPRPSGTKFEALLELARDFVSLGLAGNDPSAAQRNRLSSSIKSRLEGTLARQKDLTPQERQQLHQVLADINSLRASDSATIRDFTDQATELAFPPGSGPAGLPAWH